MRYFERLTGEERTVPAKRVIVAASAIDSTRILLNSKSQAHPNGLGNGSDVIGRYLCEQFRFHVYAFAPQLFGRPATNDDGISGGHIYIPRFESPDEKRDYLRGFGIQLWGIGCGTSAQFAKHLPGFGLDLKTEIRKRYPAYIQLHPYGEVLPYRHNRVTVEGTSNDRFGVPTIRIEYKLGENERKMVPRMYDTVEEILHSMKAEPLPYNRGDLDELGAAIHEHGTCRMGDDPKAVRAERIHANARSAQRVRGGWQRVPRRRPKRTQRSASWHSHGAQQITWPIGCVQGTFDPNSHPRLANILWRAPDTGHERHPPIAGGAEPCTGPLRVRDPACQPARNPRRS